MIRRNYRVSFDNISGEPAGFVIVRGVTLDEARKAGIDSFESKIKLPDEPDWSQVPESIRADKKRDYQREVSKVISYNNNRKVAIREITIA